MIRPEPLAVWDFESFSETVNVVTSTTTREWSTALRSFTEAMRAGPRPRYRPARLVAGNPRPRYHHRPARLVADHSEHGYYVTEGVSGEVYERALTAPLDPEGDPYTILGIDAALHVAREYAPPLWHLHDLVSWGDRYRFRSCDHCTKIFVSPLSGYVIYDGVNTCRNCYDKADAAGLLTSCSRCGSMCTDDRLVDAINPFNEVVKICQVSCLAYFHCPDCGKNYTAGLEREHTHGRCYMSSCESPVKDFSIPGIGDFRYANGQTYEVSMQGVTDVDSYTRDVVNGIVDRFLNVAFPWVGTGDDPSPDVEAINRANRMNTLTRQEVAREIWSFTPIEGKGSPAKQLRSQIFRSTKGRDDCYTVALSPEVVSEVGNVIAAGMTPDLRVSITRDLNGDPRDYGHSQSCWWGEYIDSRCVLKTHAGFALLSHDSEGHVTGRSWVIPCEREGRSLHPTFGEPEAFIVFNSYGDLSEHRGINALCVMTGWSKTAPLGFEPEHMYVNNEEARVVAPADVIAEVGRFYLPDYLPVHADDQEQAFS